MFFWRQYFMRSDICDKIKTWFLGKKCPGDKAEELIGYCIASYDENAPFLKSGFLLNVDKISPIEKYLLDMVLPLADKMFVREDIKFFVWVAHVLHYLKPEYEYLCSYVNFCEIDREYAGVLCLYGVISGLDDLEKNYNEKKIPDRYLSASLEEVGVWIEDAWKNNIIGLENDSWVIFTMKFKLFRIGRLQYEPSIFNYEYVSWQGERTLTEENMPILSIHIPEKGRLTCIPESLSEAKVFFESFFPEKKFKAFVCCTWILDPNLSLLLDENSNIIKFNRLFNILPGECKSTALMNVFGDENIDLKTIEPKTTLHKNMIEYLLAGNRLSDRFGYILI